MNTLHAIADWVSALGPVAFAIVCVVTLSALLCLALSVAFLYLLIASGAGEEPPADDARFLPSGTHAPEAQCLHSVCAWCEPRARGRHLTHGICPAHAEQLKKEAGL